MWKEGRYICTTWKQQIQSCVSHDLEFWSRDNALIEAQLTSSEAVKSYTRSWIFYYPGMKSKLKNNIVPVAGHNHARMWCSITCPAGAPPPDVSPSLSSPSYRQSSPAAVNKVSLFCPGCLAGWKPRTSPLCLWGGSIRNFWGINFAFRWAVIFPAWQHVL